MTKLFNSWPLFLLFALAMSAVTISCGKDDDDPTDATCSDGQQNQGETGVDCGGPCSACATCSDGQQNQGETGVDCGGPCTACSTQLVDADGNVYTTVTIGTQTWMIENLNTTKYNDGTAIPLRDYAHWESSEDAAYGNLKDDATQANTFGRLYNWYAVNTGKLAPAGWHVPSHAEWQTLIDFIGGATVAGGKLKEVAYTHWKVPNTGATDQYGFRVLPASWRLNDQPTLPASIESIVGTSGHFWTSTSHTVQQFAHHRSFAFDSEAVGGVLTNDFAPKSYGMSVRLIKN